MTSATMKPSILQRINPRMIILALVALGIIGYPVYIYIHETITGGIVDYGSFKLVDLKAMSNFEMDQNKATANDVPQQWRNLDGQKVVLEGEIWDANGAGDQMKHFQLCYSIAKCCFSGPPKVQHFVDSTVPPGKVAYNYSGLVRVMGTLHVKVNSDGEKILNVYQMDVDSVEQK